MHNGIAEHDVRWVDVFVIKGDSGEYDDFIVTADAFAIFLDGKSLRDATDEGIAHAVAKYLSGGDYAGKQVTLLRAENRRHTGPNVDTLSLTIRVAA